MSLTHQFNTKRLEDIYQVGQQTIEIVTRPSFHTDSMFATDVHKLFNKLNAGDQPPYHLNLHKYPYRTGFKSSRTLGTLIFSDSQPGLSEDYPLVFQLMFENPAVSLGKTDPVFLALGICQVSTRQECTALSLCRRTGRSGSAETSVCVYQLWRADHREHGEEDSWTSLP